ncbi:MAG: phospholipase D-like domain-containing protein [Caldilineaceae bacterium]
MTVTPLSQIRAAANAWQATTIARGSLDVQRQPHLRISTQKAVAQIQAAVSPDCSYRLVKAAVEAAQREICLYIYNVSAEHMLDLLRQAKTRGVHIRLMYDVTDTRGDEQKKLEELGVELREAPSTGGRRVFTVCHQKFAVIDEHILLLGSANWAGTSIPLITKPGQYKKGNREWLVRIDHEPLAHWFKHLFEADWNIPDLAMPAAIPRVEPLPPVELLVTALAAQKPTQIFDIKQMDSATPAQVTPILSPNNYFSLAKKLILAARHSIEIEQQYIINAAANSKLEALLAALAKRKNEVQIRILVSPAYRKVGGMDNWELSMAALEAHQLKDCLRALNLDYFTHLHNKGLIFDRKQVIVSSTNWSENSISRAREAGVLIQSAEIGEYFASVFDYDWSIAWDPSILPANLPLPQQDARVVTAEFEEVHPADLV